MESNVQENAQSTSDEDMVNIIKDLYPQIFASNHLFRVKPPRDTDKKVKDVTR